MNSDMGKSKEIHYVCNDCGTQDIADHICECGESISQRQCAATGGYCENCAIVAINELRDKI